MAQPLLETAQDIIEAIQEARDLDLDEEKYEAHERILDIQFAIVGQLQVLSKAYLELSSLAGNPAYSKQIIKFLGE